MHQVVLRSDTIVVFICSVPQFGLFVDKKPFCAAVKRIHPESTGIKPEFTHDNAATNPNSQICAQNSQMCAREYALRYAL